HVGPCVSSFAPPRGAREEGGCGSSPGTIPGVRWPNLAAPIRLLPSSIIQPKCRQRGSRLGSCGVDPEAQARRCGYDFQSSAANFITKPMGPNASNTRIGSSVAAGSLHVSISVILVSASFCPQCQPRPSLKPSATKIFDYRRCVLPSANGDR